MRTVYRASFRLGRSGEPPDAAAVSEACLGWVFGRRGVRRPESFPKGQVVAANRTPVGKDSFAESVLAVDGDVQLWGVRFSHPDAEQPGVQWQTDLLLRLRDGRATQFTCINRFGSSGDAVLPARRSPSRPRIIRDVLQRWGGTAGFPLEPEPTPLKADGVNQFLDLLTNPDRKRPVVLVTARNVDDRPITDAKALSSWVCGLAHVYEATDRFSSLKMKDILPRRLNCWDGAVRIYWPGFRVADDPFRHRLWSPTEVRKLDKVLPQGLKMHVLGHICEAAAYAVTSDSLSWESIEAVRRRSLMSELKEKGEVAELFELADEESRTLRSEKEHLEGEVSRLAKALEDSQHRERTWKDAYLQLQRGEALDSDEQELLPVESVADAVARAREQFDELVFALNGQSDVDANPYESGEEVYAALEWLATTYYQARTGTKSCPDFDISIRETSGWWYQGHQSEVTMSKYRNWYTTTWEGRAYWLGEHVGTGSGKDARYTIRIGFDWDRDRQKVVVGYIGQHQKTDAT